MSSVVQTESLAKEFANGRGVHGIDIEVRQGEIFGFLGPNGAGKSTTIRVLLGMAHPTSGHAHVLGFDPQKQRTEVLERVGYLPGELALHPRLTGRAHLERMASLRGLHDTTRRDELAERFGANLDRQVRSMSKGERQKIGILLAFMHRPELLVLDEPTSGLDPVMQDQFAKLMRESADDGATVFLSSHELEEVQRVVGRVTIIKDGRVVVTDSIDGLRSRSPRTVQLRFADPVDRPAFERLDGVTVREVDGDRISLAVTGSVAELLRTAARFEPVDIVASPADLDELFLAYYRDDAAAGPEGADHAD